MSTSICPRQGCLNSRTKGEVDFAIRQALNRFDEWNDVADVVQKCTGYYYEIQGVIEDAVKIGMKVALYGANANLEDLDKDA